MAKWTLPEGKIYTQADLDAAVAAALREMEAVVRKHIYHDSAGTGFAEDAFDEAILAMIPDAGAALDRALAAERERIATWLENHEAGHTTRGWTVSSRPENSPGTHAGMAYAAAIRAQKGEW